jgi:hypothetical protein
MGADSEIVGKARCPVPVAVLGGAWLALLVAGGANAAWLFSALRRAGVQFVSGDARTLDAEETGRVLAGVLAQPAFLLVFSVGLLCGPLCAWMLLCQARAIGAGGRRLRLAAICLLVAGGAGAAQMVLARVVADRAIERTEALVSGQAELADGARARLDVAHAWSERIYAGQGLLVALGMILMVRPAERRELPTETA